MPTALPIEEEEDQPVVPAQPKPRIGTTGGVIPEQASDVAARQEVQWDPDPAKRQEQVDTEIKKRRLANFQEAHPFQPDSFAPKGTSTNGRDERAFAADAEDQFNYQQRTQREAAIESRRQQSERLKDANVAAEDRYRSTGQQFYTDARGVIKPVIEAETNKALYHATDWEASTHPKTGKPVLMKRDKYGQRQFKDAPVVASLDPTDNQLYTKMPDGSTVAAGTIDEMAAHPNYNIAKVALAAKSRQVKAIHQQALAPMKAEADQAFAQLEDAKTQMGDLDKQIEALTRRQQDALGADGADTPLSAGLSASLQQLEAQRAKLDGQTKSKGELAVRVQRTRNSYAVAHATAMRDSYVAQQSEIAARLRAQGKKPESDPIYQANLQGLQSAERILQQAPREESDTAPRAAAQAAPAAVGDLDQAEPYVAAQRGVKNIGGVGIKEFARRYGDGQGPVQPASLIKLMQRSKALEEVLSNDKTAINQTMRASSEAEKAYIDQLAAQRFAKLSEEDQKKVTEVTRDPTFWDKTKGAVKSGAEAAASGGGSVLKGIAVGGAKIDTKLGFEDTSMGGTTRERAQNSPLYKLGNFIQEASRDFYSKNTHEDEGGVSKALNAAAEAAGGFAPLIASGPAAPATIGLQAAGEEMDRIYAEQIKKGVSPEEASNSAVNRALASGAIQSVLFEVLPKPLQKAGNKLIVDKIAGGALKKFLAERVAQGVEGAVLGGTTTAAGNVAAGRDAKEGVAEGAEGLGIMQAAMPRGRSSPKKEPPAPKSGAKPTPPELPAGHKAKLDELASAAEKATSGTPEERAAAQAQLEAMVGDVAPKDEGQTAIDKINKGILDTAKSARESAEVIEPALKEKEHTPPPAKSAEDSAKTFDDVATTEEASNKVASQQEQKLQKLVDDVQESSGKSREEILATRKGRDPADWAKELESEAAYHKNPLMVDPDRRANETREEIKKIDAEWQAHLELLADRVKRNEHTDAVREAALTKSDEIASRRTAIEGELAKAEQMRKSPQGAKALKSDLFAQGERASAEARGLKTPELEARRDAIEEGLTAEDRTRQSAAGGEKLRNDLAEKSGSKPTPPDRPTSDSAHAMSGPEFGEFYRKRNKEGVEGTGLTDDALAVGDKTKSPEDIKKLEERKNEAAAASKAAMEAGDYQGAIDLGMKAQFFSEAHQAATKTGTFVGHSSFEGKLSAKEMAEKIARENPGADNEASRQLLGKKTYEVRDVPVADIGPVFGEKTVQPAVVEKYQKTKSDSPIVLSRVNGVLRPVDGKHRLTAARNRGDATIKAYIATDEPVRTAKPAETQLGDQPVKVELRRGKTGELIEVEMPAKMAEKRIKDHVEILDKVLACLKGAA
jgi:hypothetical protein